VGHSERALSFIRRAILRLLEGSKRSNNADHSQLLLIAFRKEIFVRRTKRSSANCRFAFPAELWLGQTAENFECEESARGCSADSPGPTNAFTMDFNLSKRNLADDDSSFPHKPKPKEQESKFRVRAIGCERYNVQRRICCPLAGSQSSEIRVISRRLSGSSSEMTLRLWRFIFWTEPN
jgi:hypothetical protein